MRRCFYELNIFSDNYAECHLAEWHGAHRRTLYHCVEPFSQHFIFFIWYNKLECLSPSSPPRLVLSNTLAYWAHSWVTMKMKCFQYISVCYGGKMLTILTMVNQTFSAALNDLGPPHGGHGGASSRRNVRLEHS